MGQAVIRGEPTAAVVASDDITAVLVDAADAAISDDSFRIEVE